MVSKQKAHRLDRRLLFVVFAVLISVILVFFVLQKGFFVKTGQWVVEPLEFAFVLPKDWVNVPGATVKENGARAALKGMTGEKLVGGFFVYFYKGQPAKETEEKARGYAESNTSKMDYIRGKRLGLPAYFWSGKLTKNGMGESVKGQMIINGDEVWVLEGYALDDGSKEEQNLKLKDIDRMIDSFRFVGRLGVLF